MMVYDLSVLSECLTHFPATRMQPECHFETGSRTYGHVEVGASQLADTCRIYCVSNTSVDTKILPTF